jgi:hypothetical protein
VRRAALLLAAALVLPAAARAQSTPADPSPPPEQPAAAAATAATEAPPPADFAGAVTAYRDGRYGEAASAFDALARREADRGRAAVLHANAGTAAARAERWGEASWQLRRALELAPRDPIAAANLRRLREQLGEGETEAQHFTATLRGLPLRLTLHENAWAASLAATAALLLLALWRTGRAGARTAWCATALLLAALAWWPFASSAWARESRRAVVIEPQVTGRAEPDTGAEVLFRLSQGAVVEDAEERRGWRLIETEAGARGWVPAAEVRPLQ